MLVGKAIIFIFLKPEYIILQLSQNLNLLRMSFVGIIYLGLGDACISMRNVSEKIKMFLDSSRSEVIFLKSHLGLCIKQGGKML